MSDEDKRTGASAAAAFLEKINPDDVQSVSAGGMTVNFFDRAAAEKTRHEVEREKRRDKYNPFAFFDGRDKNQR